MTSLRAVTKLFQSQRQATPLADMPVTRWSANQQGTQKLIKKTYDQQCGRQAQILRSSVQILCGDTDISEARTQVQFIPNRHCLLHCWHGITRALSSRTTACQIGFQPHGTLKVQVKPVEIEGGSMPHAKERHRFSL